MVRFLSALVLAVALGASAKADIDAHAWVTPVPVVAQVGWSPELVVAYSVDNNAPRYAMITLEIKDANGVVVAGDVAVIDSFNLKLNRYSFGWYELPPGDYVAVTHSTNTSSGLPFTVLAPPPPPPPGKNARAVR